MKSYSCVARQNQNYCTVLFCNLQYFCGTTAENIPSKISRLVPGAAHIVLEDLCSGLSFLRAKPPDFFLLFSILVGSCSRLYLNVLRLPYDLSRSATVKIKQIFSQVHSWHEYAELNK
jgi:hypothetical protein